MASSSSDSEREHERHTAAAAAGRNAALPPQLLAALPGPASLCVGAFSEMSPGVAWTALMADDMIYDLKRGSPITFRDSPQPGFDLITGRLAAEPKNPKKRKRNAVAADDDEEVIIAYAGYYPADQRMAWIIYTLPPTPFPLTRKGLKDAWSAVQQGVHVIKRRGRCPHCPKLAVSGAAKCASCLLSAAV